MFRRQSEVYTDLLVALDVGAGLLALWIAYFARYHVIRLAPLEWSRYFNPQLLPFREYFFYFLLAFPLLFVILLATQRYPSLLRSPLSHQLGRVARFFVLLTFLLGFLVYTFKLEISRPILFGYLMLHTSMLVSNRVLFHWVLRSRNLNEHNQIRILIVGTDERARRVGELLERYRMWGYRVVGYLRLNGPPRKEAELPVLGSLRDLPELLLRQQAVVDEVIFVGSHQRDLEQFEEMIKLCEDLGIRTRLAADFFPTSTSRVSLEFLESLPLITFSTVPDHSAALIAKRILDFTVAGALLIVFFPLMLLAALAIKFTSPGPVFYRQVRCGLYGRRFVLVKFRTMVEGAEDKLWEIKHLNEMDGPVFKMRNDPRVTPLGRWLRKSSIDELPQLWNVLRGEMSIVGPRAPLPEEVRHYTPRQRRRLSVKPGITCLWQVSGRSEIDFQKWMDLDLQYIDNWSLWLDLQIMLRTIPAVFSGRGAH